MPRVGSFNSSQWVRTGVKRKPEEGEYVYYDGEVYRRDYGEDGWRSSYEIVQEIRLDSLGRPVSPARYECPTQEYEPPVQKYEQPKDGFVSTPFLTQFEV